MHGEEDSPSAIKMGPAQEKRGRMSNTFGGSSVPKKPSNGSQLTMAWGNAMHGAIVTHTHSTSVDN